MLTHTHTPELSRRPGWKCVACHSDGNSLAPSSTLVTLLFSLVAAVWGGALLFQRMPAE